MTRPTQLADFARLLPGTFGSRSELVAWVAANPAPPIGTVLRWGGIGVRYIGSGTVIADMPGYVPDGFEISRDFLPEGFVDKGTYWTSQFAGGWPLEMDQFTPIGWQFLNVSGAPVARYVHSDTERRDLMQRGVSQVFSGQIIRLRVVLQLSSGWPANSNLQLQIRASNASGQYLSAPQFIPAPIASGGGRQILEITWTVPSEFDGHFIRAGIGYNALSVNPAPETMDVLSISVMDVAADLAAEQLTLGTLPYASRAAFIDATVPAPQIRAAFIVNDRSCAVIRNAVGPILQTNGQRWRPDGPFTVEHFGGGTTATASENRAAMDECQVHTNSVLLRPGVYQWGSAVYEFTKSDFTVEAEAYMRTYIQYTGATASGWRVRPTNTENGSTVNSVRIIGIVLLGPGVSHTSGIGFECIMSFNSVFDIQVQGWRNCVRHVGGRNNYYRRIIGFAIGGEVIDDVTDTYVFYQGPHVQMDGTRRAGYTTTIGYCLLSGGLEKNISDTMVVESADELQIVSGYINLGRRSCMLLHPKAAGSADFITVRLGTVYIDGAYISSAGSENGIFIPDTAFPNVVLYTESAFIANFHGNGIYARGNTISSLHVNGRISGALGRLMDIEMIDGVVQLNGAMISNGSLGGVKITGGRAVIVNGCHFQFNAGEGALHLNGAIGTVSLGANSYHSNAARVTNSATITNPSDGLRVPIVPRITFGGAEVGVAYTSRQGFATVNGSVVTFSLRIQLSSKGTSTGEVRILTDLPASYNAAIDQAVTPLLSNVFTGSASESVFANIFSGGSAIAIYEMREASGRMFRAPYTDADLRDDTLIMLSGSYFI